MKKTGRRSSHPMRGKQGAKGTCMHVRGSYMSSDLMYSYTKRNETCSPHPGGRVFIFSRGVEGNKTRVETKVCKSL